MTDQDWRNLPGIRSASDYSDPLFCLLDSIHQRRLQLPEPIPWVEPSINIPYLQACQSYLFRLPLSSIRAIGSVLEHSLRLAVIDKYLGKQGAMSRDLWSRFKLYSIGDFLRDTEEKGKKPLDLLLLSHVQSIIDADDRTWWRESAKQVRNKATHIDVADLILDIGRREDFVGEYQDTDDPGRVFKSRFWWGAPFHHSDELIAREFLSQASEKLARLIVKMEWKPDVSHWASQEHEYQSFFGYSWNRTAMMASYGVMETYWRRE